MRLLATRYSEIKVKYNLCVAENETINGNYCWLYLESGKSCNFFLFIYKVSEANSIVNFITNPPYSVSSRFRCLMLQVPL